MEIVTKTLRLKRLLLFLFFLAGGITATAQNISKIEYYINTDPGFGNGINVPVTPGLDITANFEVNIAALPAGFHHLFVRSYVAPYQVHHQPYTVNGDSLAEKGGWSVSTVKVFYKEVFNSGNSVVPNIVQGEYFADIDPGFGNGLPIPITPGDDLSNVSFAFDITSLSTGFHNLFVRFKNANGQWGAASKRTFYKQNLALGTVNAPDIVQAEYFADTDPGFGNGIPIPITAGQDLTNVTFAVDLTSLVTGFHNLFVRFKDEYGS